MRVKGEVTMHASGFSLQTHLQRAPPLPHCLHNSGDFLQKTDVGPTEIVSLVRIRVCVSVCGVVLVLVVLLSLRVFTFKTAYVLCQTNDRIIQLLPPVYFHFVITLYS